MQEYSETQLENKPVEFVREHLVEVTYLIYESYSVPLPQGEMAQLDVEQGIDMLEDYQLMVMGVLHEKQQQAGDRLLNMAE